MWIWIVLIVLVIMLTTKGLAKVEESRLVLTTYMSKIHYYADRLGLPAERVAAIIVTESGGNPRPPDTDPNDVGLMQITRDALTDVNARYGYNVAFDDPILFDADTNIKVGTAYLAICTRLTGTIDLGTQAYNAGPTAVRSDPSKGLDYLHRVLLAEATIRRLIQNNLIA